MIIVSLTYRVPVEHVEPHLAAHMAFIEKGYADGMFVASGRKVPRTGGVILARGDIETVRTFCLTDPFLVHALADLELTEVAFTTAAEGFDKLKG